MGWASKHIERLKKGETVEFRPHGQSMKGLISSGDLCRVTPIDGPLQIDDIVLCEVRSAQYLHLIKAIRDEQFQIGNNRGGINGWITAASIHGILVHVEP